MKTFTSGKYAGKTAEEIWQADPNYLVWFVDNVTTNRIDIAELREWLAPRRQLLNSIVDSGRQQRIDMYTPLIQNIKAVVLKRGINGYGNNWWLVMIGKLEQGDRLAPTLAERIADSAAKAKGRRNSNAYKDAHARYIDIFKAVESAYQQNLSETPQNT